MPLRSSPQAISNLDELSHLSELVVDKRSGQRSSAKKNRRNRHYERQFLRNSLTHGLLFERSEPTEHPEPNEPGQAAARVPEW